MKHLDVPVPQTLSASYLIPLAAPMTGAEVRRRNTRAVGTRLTGPLKTLVLQWAGQAAVSVQVVTRPDAEPLPGDPDHAVAGQRSRFEDARAFVRVSATHPASLIAVHEWKARGPAAALAAAVEAPLIDTNAHVVLNARDALASLPDTTFAGTPGGDVNISLSPDDGFRWARVESWTRTTSRSSARPAVNSPPRAIRPGTPIPVETKRIVDWAIWVDGEGIVEGAATECVG